MDGAESDAAPSGPRKRRIDLASQVLDGDLDVLVRSLEALEECVAGPERILVLAFRLFRRLHNELVLGGPLLPQCEELHSVQVHQIEAEEPVRDDALRQIGSIFEVLDRALEFE